MKILLLALSLVLAATASAQTLPADYPQRVGFDQHPGGALPLDTTFADESGRAIRLGSLLGARPAVLVLAYYECPNLCSVILASLLDSLRDLRPSVGSDFDVVIVSIDPREKPPLAAAKKAAFVRRYGRVGSESGWHLLTGDAAAIHRVAESVGYRYFYDPASRQFAHPSGIVVVSPRGKISQYLLGIEFPPKELAAALGRASQDRVGPLSRALLLLCYCYDPASGKYTLAVSRIMQTAGSLTVIGLVGMIAWMSRRPRQRP
jgi:protein SCO1/2